MPVYEYKCRSCGKEFEIVQKITEDSLSVCPDENCQGEIYRKISKNVGLLFKGSGFYLTDYAKKNGSSAISPANGDHQPKTETNTNGDSTKSESKNDNTPAKKETAAAS